MDKGGTWVGAIAFLGGVAIVAITLFQATTHGEGSPRAAGLGAVIAAAGVGWILQSRRAARATRCSYCTNLTDPARAAACKMCNAPLHAGCVDGHHETYHRESAYR